MKASLPSAPALCAKLAGSGLRATRQREVVYDVVLEQRDHPTADEIFSRVKPRLPGISLATVYNCLDRLVQCGLVRQVNFERESTRYCPNLREHAHFHDESTGRIHDIDLPAQTLSRLRRLLPRGFEAASVELSFRGRSRSAAE
jgi:Fur family peroxide stress response transcriptional regulator